VGMCVGAFACACVCARSISVKTLIFVVGYGSGEGLLDRTPSNTHIRQRQQIIILTEIDHGMLLGERLPSQL